MEIHSFPADAQELASLERRLAAGNLTSSELREIEDRLLLRVTDKTRGVAGTLFAQIAAKRQSLRERQIALLEAKNDPISRIARLQLAEEIKEGDIEEIEALLLIEDPKTQAVAKEAFDELCFACAYPIAAEFIQGDCSNFLSRVNEVSRNILESQSVRPFKEMLNTAQQREILRYGGRS